MTTTLILNLFFAAFVIVGILGLLSWSIIRDRSESLVQVRRIDGRTIELPAHTVLGRIDSITSQA